MVGHGGDGGAVVQADLAVLGVAGGQVGGVVEDVGHQGVHGILGHVVAGQQHGAHAHGGHVTVGAVGVGRDGAGGVVGGGGQELGNVLVVQAHQVDGLGGGKVGDGGGGGTGHDEGGVDLAVLQGVGAVAEGLVGGLDVGLGQVIGPQDVDGVEVHAGAGGADGHVLALQISHGLDGLVQGDDLDLLGVEGGHGGEAVDGAGIGKEVGAVVGVGHHVALAEGQLGVAVVHLEDVGLGAVAHQTHDVDAGVVGGVLGDDGAEGVVGAGLAAGDQTQVVADGGGGIVAGSGVIVGVGIGGAAAAGHQAQRHDQRQHESKKLFHPIFSFSSMNIR